jgi:hypothetical protein
MEADEQRHGLVARRHEEQGLLLRAVGGAGEADRLHFRRPGRGGHDAPGGRDDENEAEGESAHENVLRNG